MAGLSEADTDLQDLLHVPSGEVAAEQAVSSSEEDTSDEAFAARHAVLEAEERQKFNSYAGENHDCTLWMCNELQEWLALLLVTSEFEQLCQGELALFIHCALGLHCGDDQQCFLSNLMEKTLHTSS